MPRNILNPNLTGKATPEVAQTIQNLITHVQNLTDLHAATTKQLHARIDKMAPVGPQNYQADGKTPLVVTGLVGQLSEPQNAKAPTATALPAFNDPKSQPGAIITASPGGVRGLYWFNGATNPGQWVLIKTF